MRTHFSFSSKINLEAEIIVYRHLLDNTGVEGRVTVVAAKQPIKDETTGQLVAKRQRKGSIGISKCGIEIEKEYYPFFFCRRMRSYWDIH